MGLPPLIGFESWLASFSIEATLGRHVRTVFAALPPHVQRDFFTDPSFMICDYEPGPGGLEIPLAAPAARRPSRCVVLKRTLRRRPDEFIRWVIAHELAHAHLRNGGRHQGEDPEHAADSLAADWGFPRP
ncbi:MAG TPA: hypothetical protein VH475_18160 [Tepidisphaeraceae bacterium]|jgi:hypothetical protein